MRDASLSLFYWTKRFKCAAPMQVKSIQTRPIWMENYNNGGSERVKQ